jgi:hypothetical protein
MQDDRPAHCSLAPVAPWRRNPRRANRTRTPGEGRDRRRKSGPGRWPAKRAAITSSGAGGRGGGGRGKLATLRHAAHPRGHARRLGIRIRRPHLPPLASAAFFFGIVVETLPAGRGETARELGADVALVSGRPFDGLASARTAVKKFLADLFHMNS